ncbi:transposase InsO family protein [Bradyrhizobium sp. LM2.7]
MPWRESCAMDQRISFISEQRSGMWTMTELCERYEISRKTGYKWLDRFQLEGPGGLEDRSHAARVHGCATPQHIVDAIVGLRLERPSWGPRKIVSKLEARQGGVDWPSASTAGEILKRAGLVSSRRPRRRAPPRMGQLTVPQHANHVWALDHKGWIRLGDGSRVEPFTVTDGFSRYLISLAATGSTQYAECQPPLERAFREYGLPQIIRSDNGSPFASTGITGLTALSVWWIKLGIRHERIDPGHPQQNGRHERFHLTLLEAMRPAAANPGRAGASLCGICARLQRRTAARIAWPATTCQRLSDFASCDAKAASRAGLSSRSRGTPGPLQRRDQMAGRPHPHLQRSRRRSSCRRGNRGRMLASALLRRAHRHHRPENTKAAALR